jgi:hypothetical protein
MSEEVLNFESLNMSIPIIIKEYPIELQREIYEYLNGMSDIEKKAYEIAFDHLKTSFNIVRSNGFKEWKKSKQQT